MTGVRCEKKSVYRSAPSQTLNLTPQTCEPTARKTPFRAENGISRAVWLDDCRIPPIMETVGNNILCEKMKKGAIVMTTKKALALFLALLMTLSLGVTALAANTWTPVPTSPDGLPNGSYYFDFSAYARKEDGTLDQTILNSINSCTYQVDFNTMDVEMTDLEGDVLTGPDAQAYLIWLRKTGVNWLPVAKSADGLQDGDYYLDVDGCKDDLVDLQRTTWVNEGNDVNDFDEANVRAEITTQLANAVISINPGDTLFELSIDNLLTYTRFNEAEQPYSFNIGLYLPVAAITEPGFASVYNVFKNHIRQYTTPAAPVWQPIPCSPDGLNNGDYYLDWTDFLTNSNIASDSPVDDETLARQIAIYNGGTWFIDYDGKQLKGTIVDPDTQHVIADFTPEMGTSYLMQADIMRQVGATWIKMEKCQWEDPLNLEVLGVVNGDKYVDITGAEAAGLGEIMREAEFYINPGSSLLEYKIVFGVNTVYLPLMDVHFGSWLTVCPVKTYNDGYNWTLMPKSTDGLNDGDYYIDVQGYVDVMKDENGDPLSETEKQQNLLIWGNADYYADLSQMKLKIRLHLPYQDEEGNMTTIEQYVPSMYSDSYVPLLLKVYHAPEQPGDSEEETQPESPIHRIMKSIAAFFLRVVEFFKKIFGK